jgi:predicted transcriptional regulator
MASLSPTRRVQLVQAMVARILVEELGMAGTEVARRLGIAPSAVSQYVNGRRLGAGIAGYASDPDARRRLRRLSREIARSSSSPEEIGSQLLQAALAMGPSPGTPTISKEVALTPAVVRQLSRRIAAEQAAVSACMRLAQKARDEYTRAVFRQIASDSLRHAEIVASLTPILERGATGAYASGITPDDVRQLIARERHAEESSAVQLGEGLGGVVALLLQSMEADERKHEAILEGLLREGFGVGSSTARRRG